MLMDLPHEVPYQIAVSNESHVPWLAGWLAPTLAAVVLGSLLVCSLLCGVMYKGVQRTMLAGLLKVRSYMIHHGRAELLRAWDVVGHKGAWAAWKGFYTCFGSLGWGQHELL